MDGILLFSARNDHDLYDCASKRRTGEFSALYRVTVSLICQRNKVENTDFVSGDGCLSPIHIFWSVT